MQTVFLADGTGWSELFPGLPHPGARFLLEHPVGVCVELCDYVVYVLRSLGIPAVTDHYVASPHTSGSHWWNAVRDTTGRMVSFWMPEREVDRLQNDGRPKGKVFRLEYGGEVRDVTAEYFGTNEAKLPMHPALGGKELSLCVFTCGNYVPVGRGGADGAMMVFRNLEPGIRFCPKEKLEWAARMVLEKEAKVESTAIRQMREEVRIWVDVKE